MKPWTASEIDFIKENLHLKDEELAARIERTPAAVKLRRIKNDIWRKPPSSQWRPVTKQRETSPELIRLLTKATELEAKIDLTLKTFFNAN